MCAAEQHQIYLRGRTMLIPPLKMQRSRPRSDPPTPNTMAKISVSPQTQNAPSHSTRKHVGPDRGEKGIEGFEEAFKDLGR